MKSRYIVTIEETVSESFEVFADNGEVALEYAMKKYKDGEFVLTPGELTSKQIAITFPHKKATDWHEF